MADRTALKVEGSDLMSLSISGLVLIRGFAVADTGIDGILELNFMKNNACLIHFPNSSMRIKGKQVKLSFEGDAGCCRITLAEP